MKALRATIVVALVSAFAWFATTATVRTGRPVESAWTTAAHGTDALVVRRSGDTPRVVDRRAPVGAELLIDPRSTLPATLVDVAAPGFRLLSPRPSSPTSRAVVVAPSAPWLWPCPLARGPPSRA